MTCTGRYAEAWQFAVFWCIENLFVGTHEGAGPADATLQDSQAQFRTKGVRANVGMVCYNTTQTTNGVVTAVTETSLTVSGVTWANGDAYRLVPIDSIERGTIEHYLDIAASDLHVALAATGACDCSHADWADGYLEKLNIIDAAAYYSCKCGQPRFDTNQRQVFLEWMSTQLSNLVDGTTDVCRGATGKDFPAMGWAEQSVTEFNAAQIIYNDILRNT